MNNLAPPDSEELIKRPINYNLNQFFKEKKSLK